MIKDKLYFLPFKFYLFYLFFWPAYNSIAHFVWTLYILFLVFSWEYPYSTFLTFWLIFIQQHCSCCVNFVQSISFFPWEYPYPTFLAKQFLIFLCSKDCGPGWGYWDSLDCLHSEQVQIGAQTLSISSPLPSPPFNVFFFFVLVL